MMLSPSTALQRMDAVRSGLASVDAAAVVLGLSSNLRYLTGFSDEPGERLLLLIVSREGEGTLIVPELYADQIAAHSPAAALRVWSDGGDPWRLVRQVAQQLGPLSGRLLLDDSLWAMFALPVQEAFSGRAFGLTSDVMEGMRARKDEGEIAAMRRAGEIADVAYAAVTAGRISGMTEISLASRLESAMLAGGADGIAFETLVASGPNSALPHYRAGTRQIESGDVVILDFGCRVNGYCSDMTRTVVCGEPDNKLRGVHDAVRRAHEKARESSVRCASPGDRCRGSRRVDQRRLQRKFHASDRPRNWARCSRVAVHRRWQQTDIGSRDGVLDRTRGLLCRRGLRDAYRGCRRGN